MEVDKRRPLSCRWVQLRQVRPNHAERHFYSPQACSNLLIIQAGFKVWKNKNKFLNKKVPPERATHSPPPPASLQLTHWTQWLKIPPSHLKQIFTDFSRN